MTTYSDYVSSSGLSRETVRKMIISGELDVIDVPGTKARFVRDGAIDPVYDDLAAGRLVCASDYCRQNGVNYQAMIRRLNMGKYQSAIRVGVTWFIPADAEFCDNRIISGKYIKNKI